MKLSELSTEKTYNPAAASLIIRIGLAAVFAYAAIDAFREPNAWISYIPHFVGSEANAKFALYAASFIQLVVAGFLLANLYVRYVALIAILMLAGIMLTNLSTILITFRDIGLIGAAAGLIFLEK
jgi:uncharacterized membrane protein YphA (DoxX/SURF4 family)